MGNFFNDLEAAIQKAASSVNTEVTVAARQQKAKEAYQKLGRMYYQAIQCGKEPKGEEFDKQIALIRSLLEEINDLRKNEHVTANEEDFADLT